MIWLLLKEELDFWQVKGPLRSYPEGDCACVTFLDTRTQMLPVVKAIIACRLTV